MPFASLGKRCQIGGATFECNPTHGIEIVGKYFSRSTGLIVWRTHPHLQQTHNVRLVFWSNDVYENSKGYKHKIYVCFMIPNMMVETGMSSTIA